MLGRLKLTLANAWDQSFNKSITKLLEQVPVDGQDILDHFRPACNTSNQRKQ